MSSAATQSFTASAFEEIFRAHERFVWGLCYRMTGNAADADDLTQETFVRAWERPPARTDEPWRPWLVSVAIASGGSTAHRNAFLRAHTDTSSR